tara:strand:+ start:28515 stop:29801 length:1287 start_codon:yes stop_codon:yes gene_type:complete
MNKTPPPASETTAPPRRCGPRPLPLHIANATSHWMSAAASLPLFLMDGLHCHPDKRSAAANLRAKMGRQNMMALQQAVAVRAQKRLVDMMTGIRAYQKHPYRRTVTPPATALQSGTTRLLGYAPETASGVADRDKPVMIAVPSLINPSYVLDLMEDHSLMRYLATDGFAPYLVDWSHPGPLEQHFGLDDYIVQRLIPFIEEISRRHQRPVHLLGYCMGGNLALAAAQLMQEKGVLQSLTLIATPWDFHVDKNVQLKSFLGQMEKSQKLFAELGLVPMDIMQLFFFSLDPTLSDRKFRRFAQMNPEDPKTKIFVAIEDWANDGPPLALNLAYDCLIQWYRDNLPVQGKWQVAGQIILPANLKLPCHVITPKRDRIVPPASAKAILADLPAVQHTEAARGHVNMIAGAGADTILWPKITNYIKENFKKIL